MRTIQGKFHRESQSKAEDLEHRRMMNHALNQSEIAFQNGKQQFQNLDKAKEDAQSVKEKATIHLDRYLLEFEDRFTKNGGKVIWARDGKEALEAVWKICAEKKAKKIVKSKSMVTEEIHLNAFLQKKDIEVIETDLGEYIQQLSEEPPYHIVAPSIHKSKEEVAQLFHEKLGVRPHLGPEELTMVARRQLRTEFQEADIGITGVNFLLSDIGGVAITENEGNARMVTAFPNTHIAITGIEKVLPSAKDLELFWPLLATHGSGQKVTVYNSIFTGPKHRNETDGPEDMYVILLDNGRTNILSDPEMRESLHCIRCGACLNVCPVYKNIGGHTYNTVYGGPIGSVITPHLSGMKEYGHLSHASSLCGACTEVCPVKINLHELLLKNRRKSVEQKNTFRLEKFSWYIWKRSMLSRRMLNTANGNTKERMFRYLFKKSWGENRAIPTFPKKSFNEQWKERNSKIEK
ncbi:LutB/LldF family L-lactate oxidation iron-sulfur protein [Membranihabitans maritimus]|uniref:LutB/LldF family L-lactate oxidation iron-sulfur protein n=1 Tax=Membranihabitans maritimus TaxID=2904244 RepID=UPI001F014F0D|nr:LutB/LldF family L-lactate oxidation iron-sulfur protein [Membranihabitans maritimus]